MEGANRATVECQRGQGERFNTPQTRCSTSCSRDRDRFRHTWVLHRVCSSTEKRAATAPTDWPVRSEEHGGANDAPMELWD